MEITLLSLMLFVGVIAGLAVALYIIMSTFTTKKIGVISAFIMAVFCLFIGWLSYSKLPSKIFHYLNSIIVFTL